MPESLKTTAFRHGWNLVPCYRGTGARVTYIAGDFREVRVELPLSWRTRNYVGTIFGGSLYASIDPIYMIMLMRNLGREYIVWDKAANIRFKKPGKTTLTAHFLLKEEDLQTIREEASRAKSIDRVYLVELKDAEGVVHASIEKTLYIRVKNAERP
ncbi:MAG: DUF4442 domain-containing protein [Bdellovibrionota bacterium]